ncbi:MAG TPA: hypothetical protein VHO70_18595, partial [Chitinispirillaceae bacterium]|nr:hypothetical protein [Chitinispirillaceae bacterium]
DPALFLCSRTMRPDCILVSSIEFGGSGSNFPKSLSALSQSIPVIILLPFADPEYLLELLNNRLFYYILFPVSVNKLIARIEEIISIHSAENFSRESFYSHSYYSEFSHELLNYITIATGYIDLLCASHPDGKTHVYCEKISESIRNIQLTLSKKVSE